MNQAIKHKFLNCSRTYKTKKEAISCFDNVLRGFGLHLDTAIFDGDFGNTTVKVMEDNKIVGYARFSWHLYDTGRYEVIGYLG